MNGFRVGHEPQPPKKLHVYLCILTGSERQNWINPQLCAHLISLSHDIRFKTSVHMIGDLRGFDSARNFAVDSARKKQADFLIMFDNDVCPQTSPLDVIAQMQPDMHVAAMPYGVRTPQGITFSNFGEGERRGGFIAADSVGAGCLIIRSEIWQKIRGPWFRWSPKDDELLSPGFGEDIAFCKLLAQHGHKVWSYQSPMTHFRTVDMSSLLVPQMGKP